ncbi:unnamed protein product [Blepharisma stoltei]|uniref:Uncharacterized protein n=1 Tax=Blepharisma stoltei TaxID=1481888 RepID=A0AAU9J2T9_9CILI|nr:unnamed protein product [Blepharisma stoltei]
MINEFCFRPFCSKPAKNKCKCIWSQGFCEDHDAKHMHFPDNEYSIEEIPDPNNPIEGNKFPEDTLEVFNNKPNPVVEAILSQVHTNILALQNIKINFFSADHRSSYFAGLIKYGLSKIAELNTVLNQLKTNVKYSASIDNFSLSLLEIMIITDNAEMEIKFLEKLKEVLLLESEVKSHWLEKLFASPETILKN